MNLREILSAVLGESGFVVPDTFFGSTAPDDIQMCYLANRASSFLREKGFQKLVRAHYTVTLSAATQYSLPTDYLEIVPDTAMIDGRIDAVNLPTDQSTWAYLKSQNSTSSYTVYARIMQGSLQVHAPTTGAVLGFEYIANTPVQTTGGGAYKQRFTADTDDWLLDDDLIILEIKWRFMQAKGLEGWQIAATEATQYRNSVMARDKSSKTIGQKPRDFLPEPNTRLWV